MSFTWPVDRTCLPPLPVLGDSPTEDEQAEYDLALTQRNAAEDLAVHVLWALSGRQFGLSTITARPSPPRGWPRHAHMPAYVAEQWIHASCGCLATCGFSSATRVHLPGPVSPPTEDDPVVVTIAGEELDPDEYVIEGDVLYRRGGKSWPSQNWAHPLGEPGTWSVTYQRGYPAPPGVAMLTGALAKEFLAACSDGDCRIPSTLVGTTRKGVSHSFDPSKILAAKMTGLTEVDRWLAAVNPNGLQAAPEVL